MKDDYPSMQRKIVARLTHGRSGDTDATVIPIEKDYQRDSNRCLTSVVVVPREIGDSIYARVSRRLMAIDPRHYYYPPDSMHITVKNIRTASDPPLFDEDDVQRCRGVFSDVVPRHARFEFLLRDTVAFQTSLCVIAYSDERLKALIIDLDRSLRLAGVPDNKKYVSDTVFFGNISICRYTSPPSREFLEAVDGLKNAYSADLPVEKVRLVSCDRVYSRSSRSILGTYALSGAATRR